MERPSKREEHVRTHKPNIPDESKHRHQGRGTEGRVSADLMKRKSAMEERPNESLTMPALNADDNYVQRWLTQTANKIGFDVSKSRFQARKSDYNQEPGLDFQYFRHIVPNAENLRQQAKGKRLHRSSPDSSLLEAVMPSKPPVPTKEDVKLYSTQKGKESSAHVYKRRKVELLESESPSQSSTQQEIFEKGPRHKTRVDRYEPKKKKNPYKTLQENTPTKKRGRKSDKKKHARKSGEDLMNNFSSKSVKQDRLTIRPSHGPGLFKNGRASSPARRRGLPDLAFSEMEFLQHPTHLLSRQKENNPTSKPRDKGNQRALRLHDEISTFFAQSKTPLAETNPNARNGRSSRYMSEARLKHNKREAVDQNHMRSQSVDVTEMPYLEHSQPAASFDSFSTFRGLTPQIHHPRIAPYSAGRLSNNASTCVTWSETQLSTGATRESSRSNHHQASPTPDSIRRSIEKTGIFRGTGIRTTSNIRSSQARLSPRSGRPRYSTRYEVTHVDANRTSKATSSLESTSSKCYDPQIRLPQSASQDRALGPSHHGAGFEKGVAIETPGGCQDKYLASSESDSMVRKRSQVVIENFDRGSGWHQQPDTARLESLPSAATMVNEQPKESKDAPITRAQIVKDTRVERPATTLPITRVVRERDRSVEKMPSVEVALTGAVPLRISTDRYLEHPAKVVLARFPSQGPEASQAGSVAQSHPNMRPHVVRPSIDDQEKFNSNTKVQVAKVYLSTAERLAPLLLGRPLNEEVRVRDPLTINGNNIMRLNTPLTGLPRRDFWLGQLAQATHPLSVSPAIDPKPLYSYQLQKYNTPEGYTYKAIAENSSTDEHVSVFNGDLDPYLEDIEYDLIEKQNHRYQDCDQVPTVKDDSELEFHPEEGIHDQRTWQQIHQYRSGEIGSYNNWYGPRQDMEKDFQVTQHMDDGPVLAETNGIEEQGTIYEDQAAEDAPTMKGFWRPFRLY